jgi:hypothetical protein
MLWPAEAYEPGRIATSFIRFKLLLSQGDQPGVLQELQHMARCSDFCHHMLWVSETAAAVSQWCLARIDAAHATGWWVTCYTAS